jgi:hypothetical protein
MTNKQIERWSPFVLLLVINGLQAWQRRSSGAPA